jgi:hypothetical protein
VIIRDGTPKTYWNELWIITDTENTPLQDLSISGNILDLVNTTDEYRLHNDGKFIDWSWWVLMRMMASINSKSTYSDDSLFGWYDMSSDSVESVLRDKSNYRHDGTCRRGWVSFPCDNNDKISFENGGARFSWDGSFIAIPSEISLLEEFTIISRLKTRAPQLWQDHFSIIWNSWTSATWDWFFYWVHSSSRLWALIYDAGWNQHQLLSGGNIESNQYNYLVYSFDWTTVRLYINWFLEAKKNINGISTSNRLMSIWLENSAYWPMDWTISDVKIYDYSMSPLEVAFISK